MKSPCKALIHKARPRIRVGISPSKPFCDKLNKSTHAIPLSGKPIQNNGINLQAGGAATARRAPSRMLILAAPIFHSFTRCSYASKLLSERLQRFQASFSSQRSMQAFQLIFQPFQASFQAIVSCNLSSFQASFLSKPFLSKFFKQAFKQAFELAFKQAFELAFNQAFELDFKQAFKRAIFEEAKQEASLE